MIGDGQEHVCSGCYEIIATHDPEAYQQGKYYYHSGAHEEMHAARNRIAFAGRKGQVTQEISLEGSAG